MKTTRPASRQLSPKNDEAKQPDDILNMTDGGKKKCR